MMHNLVNLFSSDGDGDTPIVSPRIRLTPVKHEAGGAKWVR